MGVAFIYRFIAPAAYAILSFISHSRSGCICPSFLFFVGSRFCFPPGIHSAHKAKRMSRVSLLFVAFCTNPVGFAPFFYFQVVLSVVHILPHITYYNLRTAFLFPCVPLLQPGGSTFFETCSIPPNILSYFQRNLYTAA